MSTGIRRDAGYNLQHFGHDETAVLLLAGVATDGSRSKVFEGDVTLMISVLTSKRVGVKKENIFTVYPGSTGEETHARLQSKINIIQEKLNETRNGHFIFYYSGHFTDQSSFVIGHRSYYKDYRLAEDLKRIPANFMLLILDMCFSGSADFRVRDGCVYGSDSLDTATDARMLETATATEVGLWSRNEPPMPRLWEYLTYPTPILSDSVLGHRSHLIRNGSDEPDVSFGGHRRDIGHPRPLRSDPLRSEEPGTPRSDRVEAINSYDLRYYFEQPENETTFYPDERDCNVHRSLGRIPEKVVQWGSSLPWEKSWSYSSSVFTKAIHDILISCKGKSWRRKMRRELDDADTYITVPHLNIHVKEVVDDELKPVQTPYVKPELTEDGYQYYKAFPQFANLQAGNCNGCCPL